MMEAHIATLEARIQELEDPTQAASSSGIMLQDVYHTQITSSPSSSNSGWDNLLHTGLDLRNQSFRGQVLRPAEQDMNPNLIPKL